MKLSELKIVIETIEDLGFDDVELAINDSRDGVVSYSTAKAWPVRTEDGVLLAVTYE